jgi:hypothetical protein
LTTEYTEENENRTIVRDVTRGVRGCKTIQVPTIPIKQRITVEGELSMKDTKTNATSQADDTFRLLSVAELEKMPPPEWLIEQLLMVDSQAILFGAPGEGKSFVALSFALAVATGRDWLGHTVKQGPVVYVAAEGGRGIWKRVRAWQNENRVEDVQSMFFLLQAPQLREPKHLMKLLKTTETLPEKPALIVFDTLARTLVGGDENLAKDVGEWVDNARKLQEVTKAAVLTLHHTVKRAAKGKAAAERGSSALRGAADTMMAVRKTGNTLTLSCEKQKDSEDFERLTLSAKQVVVGTEANAPLTSLVIVRANASYQPDKVALSAPATLALGLLRGIPGPRVSKRDWKEAVDKEHGEKVADRTFVNWVDELLDAGEVERAGRGFYRPTGKATATAIEVPSAAIGKAA